MDIRKEHLNDMGYHEQVLHRILSSISCGVIQHKRDTGELVLVNRAALEILGYASREEMIADGFDGVAGTVVPDDRAHMHKLISELEEQDEVESYEYKVVHKDGRVVYCYGSLQMFYNEAGECIIQRNIMDITEKVEKSKQLQDIMTMHLQMLESLSCGILAYTLPEREVLLLNKEAKRLFNYQEGITGTFEESIYRNIVEEDARNINQVIQGLKKTGDSCSYKYRLLDNGEQIVVECTTKLLAFDDGKEFILSVIQDVTEKEKTEYMLRRERQQYRDAVTANGEYEFGFDVMDGRIYHDVRYRDGSTFSEVLQLDIPIEYDELVKVWKRVKKPEMLTPESQNQNTVKDILENFENGITHMSCEYYIPDENRYYRRIILLSEDEITGHVMAIVVANDITEVIRENSRKRNELAMINRSLKKQIEITKSFSSLYFASWKINLEKCEISEISAAGWAHEVCRESKNDYKMACAILIDRFTAEDYKQTMSEFLDIDTLQQRINHEKYLSCEYVGSINGWCSATFIPSKINKKGNVTNVIYAIRGVDAEKRKELDAKRALQEAYDVANRANAAKTDFLASMSHDIRTPMNAIIGMTTIAEANLDDKKRVEDCLAKITVSSKHLLGLINEVLDMNKIESGNLELVMEKINLAELVDNLVILSKPQIEEKNHKLSVVMKNVEHKNVIGDSMRLQQVFMNLMSNAVKYTPKGGEIKLIVSEKVTNNDRVGCYEFIFEDSGIGMSEDFLKKIFEPFTRANDSRVEKIEGTGLGMPITRNIVSMMNGDIKVESQVGKGSRFTVTIFLKRQQSVGKAGDGLEDEKERGFGDTIEDFARRSFRGKRVLLVEDNELNAEIALEILGMTDLEIEHVWDGKEALEKIENVEDGYYDIVFMDIQMPVMNGYEAARAIRALPRSYAKSVPIIAMTANAFAEDVQESKRAGMNEHVAKPLDLNQLLATLNKWLG